MESPATKKGKFTAVLLLATAILGVAILATDQNVWQYQPSHAYGLAAFVVIDLLLAGVVLMRGTRSSLRISGIWGLLQALIMVGDIFWPSPFGSFPVSQTDFAKYLFGLGLYDSKHIAYLFPTLFVLEILVLVVAFWEMRKAK
ncbi:MAG: hypothetical protein OK452_06210 [Thaumarchaeota archaeon]|nr:hypothetical protein [Nitrososphaerota archaeon]